MSAHSWWKWGRHGLDTSGYDTADDKVNKYTKLLDDLNEKISNYESERETLEANYDALNKVVGCYNEGTLGHWVNFYSDKVDQWKENKKTFYGKMEDEFAYAKKRRDRVSELKDDWIAKRRNAEDSLNEQLAELDD